MSLQGTMIMDIQDECFTKVMLPCDVTTDAEYEAACSMVAAMESDGAPDPSQYISYCSSPRWGCVRLMGVSCHFLILYHTFPTFDDPEEKAFLKTF